MMLDRTAGSTRAISPVIAPFTFGAGEDSVATEIGVQQLLEPTRRHKPRKPTHDQYERDRRPDQKVPGFHDHEFYTLKQCFGTSAVRQTKRRGLAAFGPIVMVAN
jgi:hypothetical protein